SSTPPSLSLFYPTFSFPLLPHLLFPSFTPPSLSLFFPAFSFPLLPPSPVLCPFRSLAQKQQQNQNLEDAAREIEKPLARYIDDTDLDKMLREQERDGDPMAKFLSNKKAKESKEKRARPKYTGPNPPPNRFNILPGYRWDGVDR
ncbi:hypothetical protein FKM82_025803, partial [Ascaphus truei]